MMNFPDEPPITGVFNPKAVPTEELNQPPRHGPDYKRMSKKQRGLLLVMLEFLEAIIEDDPAVVTDARAHLMIESIEPHYKALKGIMAQYKDVPNDDDDTRRLFFDDQVRW